MIKFSVNIPSIDKLKTFLANSELDYISVLATPGIVYFMSETKELYMHYAVQTLSRYNLNNSEIFRLDRKTFASLVNDGVIEFELTDSEIIINFRKQGGTLAYSYKTIRQIDVLGKFLDRLALLENIEDYPMINLAPLSPLAKMSRSTGNVINCGEDVASVKLGNGFVYSNLKGQPFVCPGKAISLLLSYTLNVYNVQNYLMYNSSDIVVMVTKYRQGFVPDIDYIKEQKTHFLVDFEMGDCTNMCKKLRPKDGTFVLDLNLEQAILTTDKSEYITKVNILKAQSRKPKNESDELDLDVDIDLDDLSLDGDMAIDINTVSSTRVNLPRFEIPFEILGKILVPIGRNKLSLMIKKNFIIIKVKAMFIVFARKDV